MSFQTLENLAATAEKLAKSRVMVVGDVMLDRYTHGDVTRLSPEAPVPVLKTARVQDVAGGAGNVAANLRGLGAGCTLISVTGDDEAGATLRALLTQNGTDMSGLLVRGERPTTLKHRFLNGRDHLLRADTEETGAVSADIADEIFKAAEALIDNADVLVLSDYAKGVLPAALTARLIALARAKNVPVLVDPKGRDYSTYKGASIVTPNRKELCEATGMECASDADIITAAGKLIETCGIAAVIATRSEEGMSVIEAGKAPVHLRANARAVFDVSGAGDTVIATIAAALAAGASLEDCAHLANYAAGVVVGKIGTAPIMHTELIGALAQPQNHAAEKTAVQSPAPASPPASPFEAPVCTWEQARVQIDAWKKLGLKVGFTNGCFDIIHPGHVGYINAARARCNRLILAINADASVSRLKGPTRPVNDAASRAAVLAGLGAVDMVVVFGEGQDEGDTPVKIIEVLKPDVIFKGGDYREDQLPEAKAVRAYGGDVCIMNLYEGHSTTAIIGRARA